MAIGGQKKVQSARGEEVDFQLLIIKQQLADAPQNIEVARRQAFIDNKEQGKSVKKKVEPKPVPTVEAPVPQDTKQEMFDFENSNGDIPADLKGTPVEPIPVIREKGE